jgi:hypothetical protein
MSFSSTNAKTCFAYIIYTLIGSPSVQKERMSAMAHRGFCHPVEQPAIEGHRKRHSVLTRICGLSTRCACREGLAKWWNAH